MWPEPANQSQRAGGPPGAAEPRGARQTTLTHLAGAGLVAFEARVCHGFRGMVDGTVAVRWQGLNPPNFETRSILCGRSALALASLTACHALPPAHDGHHLPPNRLAGSPRNPGGKSLHSPPGTNLSQCHSLARDHGQAKESDLRHLVKTVYGPPHALSFHHSCGCPHARRPRLCAGNGPTAARQRARPARNLNEGLPAGGLRCAVAAASAGAPRAGAAWAIGHFSASPDTGPTQA
jgi:hypothetical protein